VIRANTLSMCILRNFFFNIVSINLDTFTTFGIYDELNESPMRGMKIGLQ